MELYFRIRRHLGDCMGHADFADQKFEPLKTN